ncbi:hypothetical protein [Paenibacillus arenilitoris]|uniref:Uncharacterized protein n=1 Tax=Paenibacillus arenilitoris TaxID=2772299 RepID=A0A927CIC5_9BACL|nr:hypothetical protein [Paenibacillus arenilitoris]MBD2867612.1 hypothetical protein [Paenibacillus arenilitoris]
MLRQTASHHVPYFSEQSPSLTVSRIELFVIPALAIDSPGYRVCLRLTSDAGFGWSELFVDENDEMIDLERWSDILVAFVGRIGLPPLHDCQYDGAAQSGRALDLFKAAVNHAIAQSPDQTPVAADSEEYVLRQRAVNYLSLL